MPDPTWPSSPPEANYLRLAGPGTAGTASTTASAAAWQALAVGDELAMSVSALNTAVTALDFEGVGGVRSAIAGTGLNTALSLLAGWAQEKPPIAAGAVAAYETAISSMIPAEVSLANRAEQAADVALNPLVLGALTPVIVALDIEYFGEHWPHNAAAGLTYGAALAALAAALTVPPPLAPPGASAAGPAGAAAALAQGAAQAGAGEAMRETAQATKVAADGVAAPAEAAGQAAQLGSAMVQPVQSMTGALQPAMGMFAAPLQAFQSFAGLAQPLSGARPAASAGEYLGDAEAAPMLGAAAAPGAAGGPVGAGFGGAGSVGTPGSIGGPSGVPSAGLTSFTRPNNSFAPELGGRPTGLKTGLLNPAEVRGPTAAPSAGGPVPVVPGHGAIGAHGKDRHDAGDPVHARILLTGDRPTEDRLS